MTIEAKTEGKSIDLKATKDGVLLVQPAGSKYGYITEKGNVFIGSNALATPVTTQAGLSATTPALTLYNPVGSLVNLKLLKVNIVVTTAPAANTIFSLAYNEIALTAPATVTDATITNGLIGKKCNNEGRCYRVATLAAAPVAFKYLGGVLAASSIGAYEIYEDIDGEIVIPPGGCVSIQTTTAVAILASFTWQEDKIS